MIDGNDDEQSRENEKRECSSHRSLRPQVCCTEEERKANGDAGAPKQHQPDNSGHYAGGHHNSYSARLRDKIELM